MQEVSDNMSDSALQLQRVNDAGFINLRGSVDNKAFLAAIERVAGVALPLEANTFHGDVTRAYWLGPDEWMLQCRESDVANLQQALDETLRGQHTAVNDLTGGFVMYGLRGPGAAELLAAGCTLDLHPLVFTPGCCAQSGLAKATVLLARPENTDGFDVIVRRSFADYLWQWLARTGRDARIEVT